MKKYFLALIALFFTISLSSNELSWVDTQVEAIKPPRKGMSNANLAYIKSPFIFLNGKSKKRYKKYKRKTSSYKSSKKIATASSDSCNETKQSSSGKFVLSAVINNSALINGKWYKLNDTVSNYKVFSVNRTSVVLTRGDRKLVLSTSDTKRTLKFK